MNSLAFAKLAFQNSLEYFITGPPLMLCCNFLTGQFLNRILRPIAVVSTDSQVC